MENETQPGGPSAASGRIRVLCVDDSADIGQILARLVHAEPDLEDAGVLDSAERILEEVVRRRADVVVLDLTMPGPDPVEAIRVLAERAPSCRVIAFSGYDDPETKDEVCRAGAWGLVSKHGEPRDLLRAIRLAREASPPQATRHSPGRTAGASDAANRS